jgi:hypothetical protein
VTTLRLLEVRERLGSRLDIRVTPERVTGWVWSELPLAKKARNGRLAPLLPPRVRGAWLARIRRRHPFVLDRRRFPAVVPIEEYEISRWVTDLVLVHRDTPEKSLWLRDVVARIERDGWADSHGGRYHSRDAFERFLNDSMLPLIASIEQHGFDPGRTDETGWALIGPRGEVFKTKRATHRFFIARALGVPTFPLRVAAVHTDWWRTVLPETRGRGRAVPGWEDRLVEALAVVSAEHSD